MVPSTMGSGVRPSKGGVSSSSCPSHGTVILPPVTTADTMSNAHPKQESMSCLCIESSMAQIGEYDSLECPGSLATSVKASSALQATFMHQMLVHMHEA